jgi:methylase of polypeptide subunit release factors
MKARALIRQGTIRLKDSPAIDHWQKGREKIESEILLFDLLGEEPYPDDKISAKNQRTFEAWIERRYTGEPIAHITGTTEFKGLDLIVEPGVFVPRDSSEWLAEQAIPQAEEAGARRPREWDGHDRARRVGRGAEGRGVRRRALDRGGQARAEEREAARREGDVRFR